MKRLLTLLLMLFTLGTAFGQITVTGSVGADNTYTSLTNTGGAFEALNLTAQTGATIMITITADVTTEAGTVGLNAGAWTSVTINPVGARTISGTVAGAPMILFNGADYVTIDGLNTGGNSLVISNLSTSATSATSTIRFIADATNNTITNCSVLGSATMPLGTNGGNIFISTGTATGNDNISITNCLIGPAGSNLPSKGIYGNGSTTSSAIANSNVTINNCEIFDYFLTSGCAGVYALTGNTDWTITNNKIYQTAARTFTATGTMYGVYFSNTTYGNNIQINQNTIGYASNLGTGTLSLLGNTFAGAFTGIYLNALSTAANACNINGNNISDISLASSTGTFYGINNATTASSNTININNNIVRNIATTTTTGSHYGIASGNATNLTVTYNTVNNITRTGGGALYGISMSSPSTGVFNYNVVSNLALNNATSASTVYGIYGGSFGLNITINANTIFNLSTTSTAAVTIYGIYEYGSTGNKQCSNNTIFDLSAQGGATIAGIYTRTSSAPLPMDISLNLIYNLTGGLNTYGIQQGSGSTTANIFKNKIYGFTSANTNPLMYGVYISSGTTNNIYNNLIGDLNTTAANAAIPLAGIYIGGGTTANLYYNTVNLNATSSGAVFGSAAIYASTTPTVNLRNNIFVNTSTPNTTGITAAYRRSTTTLTSYAATSNNNIFYAGATGANNLIMYDGTNSYQTLATYITAVTPRDASSFTENPNWASTVGANTNYLHINTATPTLAESGAVNIATFTDDFDAEIRQGNAGYTGTGTAPDIGADEFNGTSPAPAITFNSITPATMQCVATARLVSVNATTISGTITGVTITYNNGTATGPVAMTNVSGNTWTYTIPAASPGNTVVTWSVTATNSLGLTSTYTGATYQDELLTGVTMTASASLSPVCAGSPTVLTSTFSSAASAPTYTAPPAVTNPTTDEDLGNVTLGSLNNTSARNSLVGTIGTAAGTAGSYSDFTAFGPYDITAGNTYTLSVSTLQGATAYSNAIGVYIDYNRNGVFTDPGEAVYVSSATTSGAHTETSSITIPLSASIGKTRMRVICNEGLVTGPTMTVGYGEYEEYMLNIISSSPAGFTYAWSNGASTVGTTNPATVNPLVNTTYTVTATDGNGCTLTAGPVVVNAIALPSAPTANNSTQCGTAVPSCSVTSTTAAPTPVFVWYTVATGGTPIAGVTGNTYTGPAISATTTFYVAETDGTCESNRVAVTANVVSPDAVTAAAATLPACLGNSITLTATQTGSTQTYVYEWASLPVSGSGIATTLTGASVTVTPTIAGTYVYTVTATDAGMGCATTADVSVTVSDLPTGVSATASQTTICAGSTVDLSALPNTGTVAVINENFNTTNSWTATNTSTGGTPANAAWTLQPDAYYYAATAATFHSNDNSQFYLSNSDAQGSGGTTLTILESPSFSTVGMTSCNLSFYHYFRSSGDSAVVEIFDGTNWIIASSYTSTVGTAAGFVNANISLNSYLNLPSAKIRFRYKSSWGYYWAIDNVVVNGVFPTMTYAWTSAPAGFNSTDQNPVGVTPAATTTYTVAVSNAGGCASTASVTVNVTPLPTAPTANNSAQCGTQVPTCSVTSTSGATSPVFNWYAASTGGTPIAGITGNVYTGAAVSSTTTFYVTEADGACESTPRTAVTVTVNLPDAITASAVDSICLGQSVTLTAAQTGSTNTYVYEWAAAPVVGSGIPTTVSGTPATVTPTAAGTYVYTATATDAGMGCVTTATKSVKVNDLPSGVTATASNTSICLGASVDLFSTPASGTVSLLNENFNAATNAWTTTNTSTGGVPDTAAWTLQPDGFAYGTTIFHSNDNSQFYLSNSDAQGTGGVTVTILESPAFSTVGKTACTLSFYHYYRYYASTGSVEIFDGSTWTSVASYTSTQGAAAAFTNVVIPLDAYLNLPVVKVRFRYNANYGYYWAIDNVTVNATSPVMTYAWTSLPAGFTSSVQNPTAVIPTATTAYTVAVTNTYGCSSTASVTVNANAAPVVDLGNDTTICDNATITLNAQNNGMTYLWNTTATSQTITVDSTGYGLGTFPFWVTVNNLGCQVTDTIHITFAVCGGIEENSGSIAIYPNPTNGMLYLSSGSFDDNMSVSITTVDGKLIMAEKVNTLNGTQQRKEIDLSKVPAGVYFVRMQGNNLDKISRIVKSY